MTTARPTAVLGAGSWGTALALLLVRHGHATTLWGRDAAAIAAMRTDRVNARYLPGVPLPAAIGLEHRLDAAVDAAGDVLLAVPSHAFGGVLAEIAKRRPRLNRIAWATKGFEPGEGRFLDALVAEAFGERCSRALISGPSFAAEVARDLPSAVTLASNDGVFAEHLGARLHGPHFRVYSSDDLVGVQVCGAVKNVLAIAAGIADGLDFGANARAALITRGLAELTRLGLALGGRAATFSGLAGVGDLILTCTDDQSRNRRFGLALGRGDGVDDAAARIGQVVEGLRNTREVMRLAGRRGVEMPIARAVERVLFEGLRPEQAVRALLARTSKSEVD